MSTDEEVAAAEVEFWCWMSELIAGSLHEEIEAVGGVDSSEDLIAAMCRAIASVAAAYGEATGNVVDVDTEGGVSFQ